MLGSVCSSGEPALEHFAPGASAGTVLHFPHPEGARSLSVSSQLVQGDHLYWAGQSSSPDRGYLAEFSDAPAEIRIVPTPPELRPIIELGAAADDSLWIAPMPEERETAQREPLPPAPSPLWRRAADGVWHVVTYPTVLEPGSHAWTMPTMGSLFALGSDVFFAARYQQAARAGTLGKTALYRSRPASAVWVAPGPNAQAEPRLAGSAHNPCSP